MYNVECFYLILLFIICFYVVLSLCGAHKSVYIFLDEKYRTLLSYSLGNTKFYDDYIIDACKCKKQTYVLLHW